MTRSIVLALSFCLSTTLFACGDEHSGSIESVEAVDSNADALAGGKGGKGKNYCAIKCAAPADGCHYEDSLTYGPCHKVTCGDLVCEQTCALMCAAPPDGCHYENAMPSGPCDQVTCGTLVCDGSTL